MYEQQIEEGYQALDLDTVGTWARAGYAVVEPGGDPTAGNCAVTPNTGTLDTTDTLSIASGTVIVNGQEVSVASQSVGINSVGTGYRFDTVWVDSSGTVQVAEGNAVASLTQVETDNSLSRFELFSPAHPFPSTTPATVLAAVAVNDSDSSVTQSQIQDRRVPAEMALSGLTLADRTGTPATPTDGRTLYIDDADGNLYKVNPDSSTEQVGGGGALSDSGTDTDGGDDYQLPQAADNIDLQSDGAIQNADEVSTNEATITNVAGKIFNSSSQSVSSGVVTQLSFDSSSIDSTVASVDTANDRIQIQQAGTYLLIGKIRFDGSANWSNGDRIFGQIQADGSGADTKQLLHAGSNEYIIVDPTTLLEVTSAETPYNLTLFAFHNSGSSETISGGAKNTFLTVGRLG